MARIIRVLCRCDGDGCKNMDMGTVHWHDKGPKRYLYEDDRYLHKLPQGWIVARDQEGRFRDLCPDCQKKYKVKDPSLGVLLAEVAKNTRY